MVYRKVQNSVGRGEILVTSDFPFSRIFSIILLTDIIMWATFILLSANTCNPLQDDEILDWSILKQIADIILKFI